ncbi:MAG TPA: aldehyde ferredoxin oxidoreductase C-terminal domain-containing protein [Rectinemataceae bacterium]|nr:aldehyde ferredoxin oxidoreductase C-terminal domain-containing protein [Rectinemataceae bacterium]
MDSIIRIDVSAAKGPKVTKEGVGSYAGIGGRALTSALIYKEVPALCHPLGPENKLVIAPGILSGTAAGNSGRLSIGCKSPLTGGIKESNAGGQAAQVMARLGYAAIVLEGAPAGKPCYLVHIDKNGIKIEDDQSLKGLGNYALIDILKKRYGDKVACISIGQAGEMKLPSASIACTDMEMHPTRHAGRGGVGAVMGAKGVKAIVLDDEGCPMRTPKDPEKFKAANKIWVEGLKKHPVTGGGLPSFGTNVLSNIINEAGGLPTNNFRTGQFAGVSKVSGETMAALETKRGGLATHGCHRGCVIQCSGIYNDAQGNYLTKQPEYETVWAHGANCGIDDIDAIARLDRLEDDIGLDTIEMGAAIGVAMEAGYLKFGDAEGAIRLIEEVGKGTPMGRIIGSGTGATAKAFGIERAPVVKNQAMPAYDPRAVMGMGVTYATTPMGADHTAGYAVTANVLKVGGFVDPLKPEGQIELSRNLQIATAAIDSTGMCLFIAFAVLDQPETFQAFIDLINAFYGLALTGDDVTALGKSILKNERDFNKAAGFTKEDDRLPMYFRREAIAPHNVTFQVKDEDLDKVFNW